jgi:hypothetical protein
MNGFGPGASKRFHDAVDAVARRPKQCGHPTRLVDRPKHPPRHFISVPPLVAGIVAITPSELVELATPSSATTVPPMGHSLAGSSHSKISAALSLGAAALGSVKEGEPGTHLL